MQNFPPKCFKMTNSDRFHREAMGGGGLGAWIQIIQKTINVPGVLSPMKL